jgi:hypothetical protein
MDSRRHFTTRRAFVGAMGFGALGLYGTWAAIGASPLPFGRKGAGGAHPSHAGHDGHSDPQMHEAHGASAMSPEEFERRHADFLKQFRQADGSIRPTFASAQAAKMGGMDDMPGMDGMEGMTAQENAGSMKGHQHGASAMADVPGMAGMHHEDMAGMSHTHQDAPADEPAPQPHDADSHAAAHDMVGQDGDKPVEVFLAATRWSFEPDNLQLEVGRPYRFTMMATDIAHGASIAFGPASRIVRLRPGTVTTLDLTFLTTGRRLVYCTVYCGPGHDAMHGAITVA